MELRVLQSFGHEVAEIGGFAKLAAPLTAAQRADLPGKDFAVKAKKSNTGKEAYPIPDRRHASIALGLAKMHGDSADLSSVRAKVKAKYPDMLKAAMRELIKNGALRDLNLSGALHAAREEAGPALGAVGGAALAGALGKSTLGGAALGYGAGSLPELILGGKGHGK
jgi:hypothetical protein